MSEFQNVHRFGFNMDNPEIVCPYCGYTYTDSNELSADEDEIECKHCERKFYYGRAITVEYETHKIDEDGDIDYLDELMEFTEG